MVQKQQKVRTITAMDTMDMETPNRTRMAVSSPSFPVYFITKFLTQGKSNSIINIHSSQRNVQGDLLEERHTQGPILEMKNGMKKGNKTNDDFPPTYHPLVATLHSWARKST